MANIIGSLGNTAAGVSNVNPEEIDRIRPLGRVRHVQVAEVLFKPGDATVPSSRGGASTDKFGNINFAEDAAAAQYGGISSGSSSTRRVLGPPQG